MLIDATATLSQPAREPPDPPLVASPEPAATFAPEDLVAFRYRVRRLMARGGMGEVYEVEDLELREAVALKVVRREIAGNAQAQERFKREITLARRVTHPHVCRIFDVGFHVRPDTAERIAFFTMELLRGETLADRLRRDGALAPHAALPLVRQMAQALGAAHRVGIIHRDFKTANVFLVPAGAPARGGEARVVVTDFGLAKDDAPHALESHSGLGLVGTPAYMAPEQVEGRSAGPATDLYALGVVMYELVTGMRPFTGDTAMAVAVARLERPAPSPRRLRPDLDAHWEAAIVRCLAREPADRPASAAQVLTLLLDEARPLLGRRAGGRVLLLSAALAGIGALGVYRGTHRGVRARAPAAAGIHHAPAGTPQLRRGVAIIGFDNLAQRPEMAWIATALGEMLATELGTDDGLRVSPGELVARMKSDFSLSDADTLAPDTLRRIHAYLGCDWVVSGAYLAVASGDGVKLRVDLRVQGTTQGQGETLLGLSENGSAEDLAALAMRAGERLRRALGIPASPAAAGHGRAHASLPTAPRAARAYAEGLQALRQGDDPAALAQLQQAAALAPEHPLVHAALSEAYGQLGLDAQATAAARQARDLSAGLSREERLLVEGRYLESAGQWAAAATAYRTLFEFFPDNVEYGLGLARALQNAGQPAQVYATLAQLRRLPAPAGEDPRIDAAEAAMAFVASDYARASAAAERAAVRAAARGGWQLVAETRFFQLGAAEWQDRQDELPRLRQAAIRAYERAGDRKSQAQALLLHTDDFIAAGDLAGALRACRDAEQRFRALGNRRGMGLAWYNLARVLEIQGDLRQALAASEQFVRIGREIGHRGYQEMGLLMVGTHQEHAGALVQAERRLNESLALSRTLDNRQEMVLALRALAHVRDARGDAAGAAQPLREAARLAERDVPPWLQAMVALDFAAKALDDGRPAEAERAVTQVLGSLGNGRSLVAARALVLGSRALRALGRVSEAAALLARFAATVPVDGGRGLELEQRIEAALVQSAGSATALPQAEMALEAVATAARQAGFVDVWLEAERARAEVALDAGQHTVGQRRLQQVLRQARARGWLGWARRAAALGQASGRRSGWQKG